MGELTTLPISLSWWGGTRSLSKSYLTLWLVGPQTTAPSANRKYATAFNFFVSFRQTAVFFFKLSTGL